jgi:hypothetical protein
MTWGLRQLCRKTVAVLEGGYDLKALRVSTEAVVKTLLLDCDHVEPFNNLLSELSGKPGLSVQ